MLITGPWQEASSNYSCLFDQISVPASLIQPGVLRCYCPGRIKLHLHTIQLHTKFSKLSDCRDQGNLKCTKSLYCLIMFLIQRTWTFFNAVD